MKREPFLILSLVMFGACMKPSEHSAGVEDQPTYPYQQSPSTVHTQPAPAADRLYDGGDDAPQEFPDSPGRVHTPPLADASLGGDAGVR